MAVAACLAMLGMAGCAMAPATLSAPAVVVPVRWSVEVPRATAAAASEAWWRDFGSAELDELVARAMTGNSDLKIAAARLAQARALVDGADAERRPQLALSAAAMHGRDSAANPRADITRIGLRAGWEMDVFGDRALASSAAGLDADAAASVRQAMQLALAADVTQAYFESHTLAQRLQAAEESVAALERQVQVTQRRFEAGQVQRLDVDRLLAELELERASLARLSGERAVRLRQLTLLLGESVPWTPTYQGAQTWQLAAPAPLPPSDLLERRPDVRAPARVVEAAAARVGVAKGDLYPRLRIDWAASRERLAVPGAGAAPVAVLGYGISLSLPILDGGRIRANIAVHEARLDEAMAVYERAMLAALADAETALIQWRSADAAVAPLERALAAAADAEHRSQRMFDAGLLTLDTVLDARRNRLRTLDGLLQAQGARWGAAVAVRRAFAGAA
jgi:multidrug efflux system outer membrane protein